MRLYMAAAPVAAARRRTAAPVVRADVTFVDGVQQANKARRTRARAVLTPCPHPCGAYWAPSGREPSALGEGQAVARAPARSGRR